MKVKRRKVLINSLALISSSFIIGACEGGTPNNPAKSTAFIKKK